MNDTNLGVNENGGVPAPVVSSPVTQTPAQIVESSEGQAGVKSAETLKPDNKIPDSVPYQRFKEINDRAKAAEELIAAHRENLEALQALQAIAAENPDFATEFETVVTKYAKGEKPKQSDPVQNQDPIALLTNEVAQLKAEKNKERQVSAVDSYDRAYEQKASEIPQELRSVFDEMVAQRVLAYNKGVPTSFNPTILDKAFTETKKLFEPTLDRLRPVAQAQHIPAAINGEPAIKPTQVPRTFDERRAYIQRMLESGKRIL